MISYDDAVVYIESSVLTPLWTKRFIYAVVDFFFKSGLLIVELLCTVVCKFK